MRTSFEEKTYEDFFNTELNSLSDIYFPLGQVQEGVLGFDSSAMSRNRRFWRRLGFPFWLTPHFTGVELQEIANEMENYLRITIDNLPPIKINLLIQYKKPAYMKSVQSKEWGSWNQPYFRYSIYPKQQDLLNRIDTNLGTRVLIIYASPAIRDINELVELKMKNRIIKSSNFTKASKLNGHSRNTYVKSGTHSIAFSKPEEINSIDLIKELQSLNETNFYNDLPNRKIIIEFAKMISSIIREDLNFEKAYQLMISNLPEIKNKELLNSFIKLKIFKQVTGIQWLVKI